ncbi:MAG: MotA/TolQ/ExbB proton channel family protein [Planctomycetes bacterium]|nr:MotA/TolQ/ExbB proton channel family protein [Planctomycetota bacterium]
MFAALFAGALAFTSLHALRAATIPQEAGPSGAGTSSSGTSSSDGADADLDADAAKGATEARDAIDAGQTTLLQSLLESGICGLLIFLLSILGVAMIVEHALTIRKTVFMPDAVVEQLDSLVRESRVDEAIEVCLDPRSTCLLSNVVLAGLERFRGSEFGFAEFRAAAEEAGEEQTARLYRKTEVLGVIGAIAPMLGLMGTVLGMIKSFNVIAQTHATARPDQLAGGISEALTTTLMGLVVAIPVMVAFSYFRNKIDSLVAETGKRVEQILMPLGRR